MALNARQAVEGYGMLVRLLYGRHPGRGQAAAVTEVNRLLGERGRRNVREALRASGFSESGAVAYMTHPIGPTPEAKAAKKAARKRRKAVKRAAREAVARLGLRESLTAAQAPQPAPGTGMAPAAPAPADDLVGALGAGQSSPFWRARDGAAPEAVGAVPAVPLDTLSADELAVQHRVRFDAYGEARGFGSPFWAGAGG